MQPLVPNYVTLGSRWIPLNQRLEVYLHTPLSLFVYDRKNFKSKNIKSIDGWNEFDCHIATGRNKNGRIYYRSHPIRSKYDYFIWVRMKRTQKKDFARMKSFNKDLTSA